MYSVEKLWHLGESFLITSWADAPVTAYRCLFQALSMYQTSKLKKVYFDFADMLSTNPRGDVPYTPVLPLLHGLRESVRLLRSEGMDNVNARHHRLAEGTRKAVAAWGLELLCENPRWASDSLTVGPRSALSSVAWSCAVGLKQDKEA